MPTVPPDHDRFRVLREPSPRTPAPKDVGRILRGPNSIPESPELVETFIRNIIGRPVDPLSPNAMFRAHVEKSSGLTPLSLTEGPPPSARDGAVDFITDTLGGNRDLAERLVAGAEFAIPPVGAAFAANDFGRSVASGDIPGSLIAMVGIGPGKLFSKLGARPKAVPDDPVTLGDGRVFERQTYTSKHGRLELQTHVDTLRPTASSASHSKGANDLPVYTLKFETNLPEELDLRNLSQTERMGALFTVQNNMSDFVMSELAKGQGFKLQYAGASGELEAFYERLLPHIEAAFGLKAKRGLVETSTGTRNGFIFEFPGGHRLP